MCDCGFDPPEFYHQSIHKARKEHKCSECKRTIMPGEQYESVWGKWDGDTNRFNTCALCLELKNFIDKRLGDFCFCHGNMREDAIETARNTNGVPGLLFGVWRREIKIRKAYDKTITNMPMQSS